MLNQDTGAESEVNGTLVIGVDVTNAYNTISRLTTIDLIVSVLLLILLCIIGIAVVRASLRPLTDIEETARGHRGRGPDPPRARERSAHRGRAAGPVAQCHAGPDRGGVRGPRRPPSWPPAGLRSGCGSSWPTPAMSCGPR